jgi:hypothetical protein
MTSAAGAVARTPTKQAKVATTPRGKRFRSGIWREEAKSQCMRLRADAYWLHARSGSSVGDEQVTTQEVDEPLQLAEELADRRLTIVEWFSGAVIEECWRNLRLAEESLVELSKDEFFDSRALLALDYGTLVLGPTNEQVTRLKNALHVESVDRPLVRTLALGVLRAAHEQSDGEHRSLRLFRNQLLVLSLTLVVLAIIAVIGQSFIGSSLVPIPSGGGLGPTTGLLVVIVAGCIGALFSAIPSLSQIPERSQPFSVTRQQALLKVVTGAWAAIIGLMVVAAGLAGSSSQMTTVPNLAIVAALFGAGQEAVTRFADRKASTLLPS